MHYSGSGFGEPDDANTSGWGTSREQACRWLGSAIALLEAAHYQERSVSRFTSDTRSVDPQGVPTQEKEVTVHYESGLGTPIDVRTRNHHRETDPDVAELWLAIINARIRGISSQGLSRGESGLSDTLRDLHASLNTTPSDDVARTATVMIDGSAAVWKQIEVLDPSTGVAYLAVGGPSDESFITIAGPSKALPDLRLRLWAPR